MAFTEAQRATIFEVFGVPQQGTATAATDFARRPASLAAQWEPVLSTGNFAEVVGALNERIDAAEENDDLAARVTQLLTRWDEMGSSSVVEVREGATGAKGVLAWHAREQEKLRVRLGGLLGFWSPRGGWMAAAEALFGNRNLHDR